MTKTIPCVCTGECVSSAHITHHISQLDSWIFRKWTFAFLCDNPAASHLTTSPTYLVERLKI